MITLSIVATVFFLCLIFFGMFVKPQKTTSNQLVLSGLLGFITSLFVFLAMYMHI